jgi:tRNA-dihydrouridine synthase
VQIFGANAQEMTGAARWLVERGLADGIDINMGCPVRKVVKTGGGSSMLCDTTGTTIELVRKIVESVPVPVSVKMRLGSDDDNLTAPYFAREFEKALEAALRIASVEGRLKRIGEEVRKGTRMINALNEVVLPGLRRRMRAIRLVLEEREREDAFRLRRLKRTGDKRKGFL